MNRGFIHLHSFDKEWHNLGLTDEDLKELQNTLSSNPYAGDVIRGTSGCRKVRIEMQDRGKRSGARVIYIDFAILEKIYLLNVYAKNDKVDLSPNDYSFIKRLVKQLEEYEKSGYKGSDGYE